MKYMTDGERFRRDSFICNIVTGIVIALFIIIAVYTLISSTKCKPASSESTDSVSSNSEYLHLVYIENVETEGFGLNKTSIIAYDSNTMVIYLLCDGSICPLYNSDGTIKLYNPSK